MLEGIGVLFGAGLLFLLWYRVTYLIAREFGKARGIKALWWFLLLLFTLSFLFHTSRNGQGGDGGGQCNGGGCTEENENAWDWLSQEEETFSSSWEEDSGGDLWDDDGD